MIFSGLWFLIIILYSLRAFQLYDSDDFTFTIYAIGIIPCFIGFIIKPPKLKQNNRYHCVDHNLKKKYAILKVLCIISITVLMERAIKAIPLWLVGGSSLVRIQLYGGDALNGSAFSNTLYTYLALPMQNVVIIYVVISAFQKNSSKSMIFFSFVITILAYVCTASKFLLAQLFFLFSGYIILIARIKFSTFLFTYRKYATLVILGIMAIGLTFYSGRTGVVKGLYTYACGCIPCSNEALKTIEANEKLNGFITFNGVIRVLTIIPKQFNLTQDTQNKLEEAFKFRQEFEEAVMIGNGIEYNAYISMFSDFYMDFEMLGVILFSFLFGFGSTQVFNLAMKRPSYRSYGFLLFDVLLIWSSIIRFDLMMAYNIMGLVYIKLLFPINNIETRSSMNVPELILTKNHI